MIKNTDLNRKKIKTFLEGLSEDEFIDKIIIPLFSMNGYYLYRKNSHSSGEHGKDVIFYRSVPIFYDSEYIIVQAKSEKVTASNVSQFSNQIIRAFRVPFPTKSGTKHRSANYVIFINSQEHTNEANFEFPYLIDGKQNIKIISQENVIELILKNDLIPDDLKGKIEEYDFAANSFEEEIKNTIYSEDSQKINYLFEKKLRLEKRDYLSNEVKEFIIKYIFLIWEQDRSWEGTVKPMKWLNEYFDIIPESQYEKLLNVIQEYVSSLASKKAFNDTIEIVNKIKTPQIKIFQDKYLEICANFITSSVYKIHEKNLIFQKLEQFKNSKDIDSKNIDIAQTVFELYKLYVKPELVEKELSERKILRSKVYNFLGLDY